MNSFLRINNVSESDIMTIRNMINDSFPGLFEYDGKHLRIKELYSVLLSTKEEWREHCDEIHKILLRIGSVMFYARNNHNADIELDICIHMYDFRERNLSEFYFSQSLLSILVENEIKLQMSIYSDKLSSWNTA